MNPGVHAVLPGACEFARRPCNTGAFRGSSGRREMYGTTIAGALPCLLESVLNSFGVTRDHSQEYPRRAVPPRWALLPILQCCGLETELCSEFRLAQPWPSP